MCTTADGSHTDVQLYTAQQKHAVNYCKIIKLCVDMLCHNLVHLQL